jgi:hypothetical protein
MPLLVCAHHFTLLEKNMLVAGTDFPDSSDQQFPGVSHYSALRRKGWIYGMEGSTPTTIEPMRNCGLS